MPCYFLLFFLLALCAKKESNCALKSSKKPKIMKKKNVPTAQTLPFVNLMKMNVCRLLRGDGAGEYISTYRNQVLEAVLHKNTAVSDYYLLQTPFSGSQHAKGARLFFCFLFFLWGCWRGTTEEMWTEEPSDPASLTFHQE